MGFHPGGTRAHSGSESFRASASTRASAHSGSESFRASASYLSTEQDNHGPPFMPVRVLAGGGIFNVTSHVVKLRPCLAVKEDDYVFREHGMKLGLILISVCAGGGKHPACRRPAVSMEGCAGPHGIQRPAAAAQHQATPSRNHSRATSSKSASPTRPEPHVRNTRLPCTPAPAAPLRPGAATAHRSRRALQQQGSASQPRSPGRIAEAHRAV